MRKSLNRRGFTLVEVMIAILLLSIGMIAMMALQFGALNGARASQDQSTAVEIGRRVAEILQVESLQWRQGTITADVTAPAYTANTPFIGQPMLVEMAGNAWNWRVLTPNPVDGRMVSRARGGRYCILGRGGLLPTDPNQGTFQAQLAVVYPPSNDNFPAGTACNAINLTNFGADSMLAWERSTGWRAIFMGTQVRRRDYMAGF